MFTQSEDVVKLMTFDVDTPVDTVFKHVEKFGDTATTDLNLYNYQKCINLAYSINKTGQQKVGLQEWNRKYTSNKSWATIKPYFHTEYQELNDVADKTMVYADFHS